MSLRKHLDTWLRSLEQDFTTHNRIEISASAIQHNLKLFTNLTGHQIIPVLKGNAYGHGIEQVVGALKGERIPYIAVDGYFEALRVRQVSRQPVLIMGAILPQNFAHMNYAHFNFAVDNATTIHALGKTGKSIKIHLECNTGMNRYGAKPDEVVQLAKLILSYKNLHLEGVMSHLADSDGRDPATVDIAVDQFDACVEAIKAAGANPNLFHIAQSPGSLKAKSKYANTIRLGVGLYGINPFAQDHKLHQRLTGLQPALKLISTVTKVIDLKKGDRVSYNYTFTAPANMIIGVLPLGYYEGVNRALSNTGTIKVGHKQCPIIGRVCMNHTIIDLTNTPAKPGDEVTVYSSNPTDTNAIDRIAHSHNLFNYNLLTALSPDIRRILVD